MDATKNKSAGGQQELQARLAPWGQEHLLKFWSELSPAQQNELAAEIDAIDFALIKKLAHGDQHVDGAAALLKRAQPPAAFRLDASQNSITPEQARSAGEAALRSGKIGVLLVAGGQGSRLGFEHAKGMFPIGPVSGASLFQILFERIVAVGKRYGVRVPLCLMTSSATHAETVAYLDHTGRFGLPAEDLFIFSQGVMPAVDEKTGQVLLAEKGHLALSPDGHGGTLAALESSGGLANLRGRGIEHIFYLQIDNPLVRICDPVFLGYHLLTKSQVTTLAVTKRTPEDKVGNLVQVDGQLQIIEYSEFNKLDAALIGRRDDRGQLLYWAGNTAVHAFELAFLEQMAAGAGKLPFHIAHKKVPFVDPTGNTVQPKENNALKFERFIFDLLPAAQKAIVVECNEAEEFAPVKNASGSDRDSPETVKAQMTALHTSWLEKAGVKVKAQTPVEISPLFALDEQEVSRKMSAGRSVDAPTYFREP